MRNIVLALALLLASCGADPNDSIPANPPGVMDVSTTARAVGGPGTQYVYVPYSWVVAGAPVRVEVGNYTPDGHQYVWMRNQSTSACVQTQINGNSTSWNNDVVIYLGAKDDYAIAVGSAGDYLSCPSGGIPIAAAVQGSRGLWVYGGDGADVLQCDIPGCFLHGEGGNDWILGHGAYGGFYGEAGDDVLITYTGTQTQISLFGGDGNDCLQGPADVIRDCGPGTDKVAGGSINIANCETFVSSCP